MRIALATSRDLPDLWPGDRLFQAELRRRGHDAEPAVWDDPGVDWRRYETVVIRSCWDYHLSVDRFSAWIGRVAAGGVRVINPPDLLHWNMHKGYLLEVPRAGGRIPDTILALRGTAGSLASHLHRAGWKSAVVKPAVSSTGHSTRHIQGTPSEEDERAFAAALAEGDVLLQAYVPEVRAGGEWSMVFFDRMYSHAALKRAAPGEFRVHVEWGGSVEIAAPPPALVAQAAALVRTLSRDATYARVDGVDVNGDLVLMELELVDPELFFDHHPDAAARLAAAVERVVRSAP